MAIVFGWSYLDFVRAASAKRVVEGTYIEAKRARGGTYPGILVGEQRYFCRRHVCLDRDKNNFAGRPASGVLNGSDELIELRVGSEWAIDPRHISIAHQHELEFLVICGATSAISLSVLAFRSRRKRDV